MKNVLLLGDSICISYREKVREALKGRAEVCYPEENGRWAAYMYNSLKYWLPNLPKPDVIHFNTGIWDCEHLFDSEEPFCSVEEYVRDGMRLYRQLKKTGATIIFATTTPVAKGERFVEEEICAHTQALAAALIREGCIINDLHGVVSADMQGYISEDGCHPTEAGANTCAEAVLRAIEPYL